MRILRRKSWSPYAVGSMIGILSWFAFASVDRPIGVSTAISRTAGMLANLVAPGHVARNAYFAKFRPELDWEWMLVVGLALGAFLSARLSGERPAPVDRLWETTFGPSRRRRWLAAFSGGVILMIGARMAGGCTSGHGISGSLQLALSGWLFFAAVFISGVIAARLLFGKEGTRG